jgi:hypothetical protein
MRHLLWLAAAILPLAAGCAASATTSGRGEDELAMAEKGKAALLELIRSDRHLFIGDPDPDILARLKLKKYDEHQYSLGAFVIDVDRKLYHAGTGNSGPEQYFYSGRFEVDPAGRWRATKPEVQRGWRMP